MVLLPCKSDGEIIAEIRPIIDLVQSMNEADIRNALVVAAYKYPEFWASIREYELSPSGSPLLAGNILRRREPKSRGREADGQEIIGEEQYFKRYGINGATKKPNEPTPRILEPKNTFAPSCAKPSSLISSSFRAENTLDMFDPILAKSTPSDSRYHDGGLGMSSSYPISSMGPPDAFQSDPPPPPKARFAMTTGGGHHFKKVPGRIRKKLEEAEKHLDNLYIKFQKPLTYVRDNCMQNEPLQTRREGMQALCEVGEIICCGNGRASGAKVLHYFRDHPFVENMLYEIALTVRSKPDITFINKDTGNGTLLVRLATLKRTADGHDVFRYLWRTIDHISKFVLGTPALGREETSVGVRIGGSQSAKQNSKLEIIDLDMDDGREEDV